MAPMKTSQNSMGVMGTTSTHALLSDAIVTAVNPATNMITLNHGELKNVGMGAMTMAYRAKDPSMIQQVGTGEKVRVRIENVGGTLTIVRLVPQ